MKKTLYFILLSTIIISGCKKYEEGPFISFRPEGRRLLGDWLVTEYTSNGIDSLQYFKDSCGANLGINDLEDDNWQFIIGFGNSKKLYGGFGGVMDFTANRKGLEITPFYDYYGNFVFGPFSPKNKVTWKLLKLTNKEFRMTTDFNNRSYKMSFKKITDSRGKPI